MKSTPPSKILRGVIRVIMFVGFARGRVRSFLNPLARPQTKAPTATCHSTMTLSQAPEAPSSPSDGLKARLVLQHVTIMHRHGDRSPVFDQCGANLFVGEKEKEFWKQQLVTSEQIAELSKVGKVVGPSPEQLPPVPPKHGGCYGFPGGHLTQQGQTRLENVGAALRERFVDFIDPSWSNDHVYVESTHFFRTIQSTQSLLKGMFPPQVDGDREPFFVRTDARNSLSLTHPPDAFDHLDVKYEHKMIEKYGHEGFKELRERVYTALGTDRSRPVPWSAARDIIECNHAHNVPLHDALTDDVVKDICTVDCNLWHLLFGDLKFCRDYYHVGVRKIFNILKQASKQTNDHKLTVLSTHDSAIVSLLKALQVDLPNDSVPWYGSHLCMETYIDPVTRAAFLKFSLNGSPLTIGSSNSWNSELGSKKGRDIAVSPTHDDLMTPFSEVEAIVREFLNSADA